MERCVKAGVLSLRGTAHAVGGSPTVRKRVLLVETTVSGDRLGTAFLQYWNERVPALVSENRGRERSCLEVVSFL
jgi:hypothetical protein